MYLLYRFANRSFVFCVGLLLAFLATNRVTGQTAITSAKIETSTASSGRTYTDTRAPGAAASAFSSSDNYTYKFGNQSGYTDNAKTVKSFTAGGQGYTYNTGVTPVIKIRRVENAAFTTYYTTNKITQTDNPTLRDLAYFEGAVNNTALTVSVKSPYIPRMEDLFLTNDITVGIDNLFANTSATNFNNIERLDVVVPSGTLVATPTAQGFALFERGVYNQHDPVVVALITGVDGTNNPISYASKVVRVATGDYYVAGQTTNTVYQPTNNAAGNFIILRRDNASQNLRGSDQIGGGQGIGGVLIKYADFGITAGTTVYGYSVLANDFPTTATGANALDYTNSTYFPTNSSDATGAAGNDMSTITGVVKILTISGNVYHDTNGLTDNSINGPTINAISGKPLYVNLVNASGKVVGTAAVQSDGSYTINQLEFGELTAQLSTIQGTVGSQAPAISLPGWSDTGEAYGASNLSGSGNEGAGTANGSVKVSIGDVNITGVDFGIEQTPVADAKSYAISQPTSGNVITLNGSLAGTSNPPGQLTGTDADDPNSNTSLSGNSSRTIVITSLPANGELRYNGNLVTAGQVISNYNSNLLTFTLTGTGYTSVSFNYAYQDAAGIQSAAVAYAISWPSALPVRLVDFTVHAEGSIAHLNWQTTEEVNSDRFEIEHSLNVKDWQTVGTLAAGGETNGLRTYSFSDVHPANGVNYYRLKMIDRDGTFDYSKVRSLILDVATRTLIYPNPVTDKLTLDVDDWSQVERIQLISSGGKIIQDHVKEGAGPLAADLDVQALPVGVYLLRLCRTNGSVTTFKLIKR